MPAARERRRDGTQTLLPPRIPLRDISHITNVVERRRIRGDGDGGPEPDTTRTHPQAVERRRIRGGGDGRTEAETTTTHRQIRRRGLGEGGVTSTYPRWMIDIVDLVLLRLRVGLKRSFPLSTSEVRSMLREMITNQISQEDAAAGFITPEKKLLDCIDIVEKILHEEIQKLKNTPLAKREEREKRVKILMSMR